MPLPAFMSQGPASFKPEYSQRKLNYRTPSPPLAYIEPVSPQALDFSHDRSSIASLKRRKLQDTHDTADYRQPSRHEPSQFGRPRPLPLNGTPSHLLQASPSPLDVFAAVATSPDIDKPFLQSQDLQHNAFSEHRNGFGELYSRPLPKQRHADRGSKRTLSEVIDVRTAFYSNARPASSHVPQTTWRQDPPQYQQTSSAYHDLQSDAELLLGFSLTSRAQSAREKNYPPPLIEDQRYNRIQYRDFGYESAVPQVTDRRPYPSVAIEDRAYQPPAPPHSIDPWQRDNQVVSTETHAELMQHQAKLPIENPTPIPPPNAPDVKPRVYRGWPKGKPRGPRNPNGETKKTKKAAAPKKGTAASKSATRKAAKNITPQITSPPVADTHARKARRHSFSELAARPLPVIEQRGRAASVPTTIAMVIGGLANGTSQPPGPTVVANICASCNNTKLSESLHELWINCNGCDRWFHSDCVGFETERKIKEVDKFFCTDCEGTHGPTTYVRKSTRAHANVDYAGLHEGKIRTAADATEHHYIQPIKDGQIEFLPETFARMPPELVTAEFFERSSMSEPVVIPAYLNTKSVHADPDTDATGNGAETDAEEWFDATLQYDCVPDCGQDKLDMIIPSGLTVRRAAELYGPEEKVEVIDVKLQEGEDRRWNMRQWADYYEAEGEKPVRNVISLEVSQSKLGRLIRRPKVVRDLDLQDAVWPQDDSAKGIFPKVQFYCLMSVADCYTDFHIDFGGSSVYYHIIKGRKTFFFIPPKPENLKKYEKWCNAPDQNNVFLGNETKECYRVDLYPGDTMLIPSGWIHAVWTPENSLVIGGNFLTRMHYGMQIQINEIEKNTGVGRKFRYPYFQKILWHAVIQYLEQDPVPLEIAQSLCRGEQFERKVPIYLLFDHDDTADDGPEYFNARYYSRHELDGLHELLRYIYRTVLVTLGKVPGIAKTTQEAVARSMPKGFGEPVEILKTFAMWAAWKRGNESIPPWALPGVELPEAEAAATTEKKKSAAAQKRSERQSAREQFAASAEKRPVRQATSASLMQGSCETKEEPQTIGSNEPGAQDSKPTGPVEQSLDQRFGIRHPPPKIESATPEPQPSMHQPGKNNGEHISPARTEQIQPDVAEESHQWREQTPLRTPYPADERGLQDSLKSLHQVQQLLPAINSSTDNSLESFPSMKPTRSKACAQCRLSKVCLCCMRC